MQNNQKTDQLELDRDVTAFFFYVNAKSVLNHPIFLQNIKTNSLIRFLYFDSKDYVTVSVYESRPDTRWRILLSHPLFLRISEFSKYKYKL